MALFEGYPYAAARRPMATIERGRISPEQLARVVRLRDGRTAQWWCEADAMVGGALYAVSDGSWLTRRAIETMIGTLTY